MQRIFILTSILCLITTSIASARVPNVLCYEDEYAHSLAAMQSLGAMNITTLSHFQNLDLSNIDPLSEGLFDTYMGANVTSSIDNDFSPNGTVIVKDPYERPIVVDIPVGNGHIVLIGHDYYASSPNQDLILANAIWRLLPEGIALPTAPTKIQYEPVLSPIMHYDPW